MMVPARTRVEYWFLLIWGVLLRLALIAGLIYCVYRVRFIIVTVILAALVSFAIEPLVSYFNSRRFLHFIPRPTRRLLVTFFVFCLVVLGLVVLVKYILDPMVHQVGQMLDQLPLYQSRLQQRLAYLEAQYNKLPADIRAFLSTQDFSNLTGTLSESVKHLIQRTWESTWRIVELILIPVLAFYFVHDSRSLKREFVFLVPRPRVRETLLILRETASIMQHYIVGQAILALLAGVVVGVGLRLLDVNYALALGVWAAITRVIPIVGPVIGGIPVVLLATAQSWETGTAVLIFFTLLHLFESKVLMPKIIGYHMRLHPAVIIIVLLIGSEFFGLMGMFLAAPVAAIIKVLINYYFIRPQLRRYGPMDARPGVEPRREEIAVDNPAVVVSGHHSGAD
jgi:predicted PurR-regulated permease PerM